VVLQNKVALAAIPTTYETQTAAAEKLTESLTYTDSQLERLSRSAQSTSSKYISDIAQINGLVEPVY
jgi:hypothetical protein